MELDELKECFNKISSFAGKFEKTFEELVVFSVVYKGIKFLICFDTYFPNSKPIIVVPQANLINEQLPHLLSMGLVCYLDDEGVVLDDSNPVGIIEEAIAKSYKTISDSAEGKSEGDFLREFEYYWKIVQQPIKTYISLVPDLNYPKLLCLGERESGENLVAEKEEDIVRHLNRYNSDTTLKSYQKILHIPLTTAHGISFQNKWNISSLRQVIYSNIGFKERINKYLRRDKLIPIYVSIPFSNDSRVHFAVEFKGSSRNRHPLLDNNSNALIQAVSIDRMDIDYLLPRGGANRALINKKVCIIGCGAVGSIIATEIAKLGILNLLLVDNDTLSKDNLYRHHLGNSTGLGISKVKGLKQEIESNLPLNHVDICENKIEKIIKDGAIDFSIYDIIIDATGVPNTSFFLLRYFKENFSSKPLLHTWLEPLGIGGHTIVSNNKTNGCYKCLYSAIKGVGLYNKACFAAPDQIFSKSMFGCAGRFTPFSSRAANKTAILAVDIVEKILMGEEADNPLLSWKGDSSKFLSNGFKLSERYRNMTSEELYETRYQYKEETCSICSMKKH